MLTITRVVCPVDFSELSRRALDYAVGIARWYGARLSVLHVAPVAMPVPAMAGMPGVFETVAVPPVDPEALRAQLAAFIEAEHADGVAFESTVLYGQVWREIVERERALHADLLVLGTHGRSGVERLLLGSVAEKLLRASTCPVLTVPRVAGRALPSQPGLFKRILCPTDFSPASDAALRWALSFAQEADADLLLLHVLENGRAHSPVAYTDWAQRRLREVGSSLPAYCKVHELVVAGEPQRVILDTCVDWDCDLIVMGVGERRDLGDRLFGSTSQHVVRSATCPVLTAHAASPAGHFDTADRQRTASTPRLTPPVSGAQRQGRTLGISTQNHPLISPSRKPTARSAG